MSKLAILSDVHGNIPALESVVSDFEARRVDRVVNLGDHLSGPLWPKATIQYLLAQDWIQILGDHDRRLVEQDPKQHGLSDGYAYRQLSSAELHWLRSLQPHVTMDWQRWLPSDAAPRFAREAPLRASPIVPEEPPRVGAQNVLLIHGAPTGESVYLLETVEHGRARLATNAEIIERLGETTSPVILCGHSHIPRAVEVPGRALIVNPGSVGLPAYENDRPEHCVMETGSPHARYAILEYSHGHWTAELIAIQYDHEKAAAQARKNGRPDWEIALRTGFMDDGKTA